MDGVNSFCEFQHLYVEKKRHWLVYFAELKSRSYYAIFKSLITVVILGQIRSGISNVILFFIIRKCG